MIKVAVVGVGGISGAHIPAWLDMDDVKVIGICDIRSERMERYPELLHYTDFDEMMSAEKPDILDICLPTYLHADFAEKALNMGVNVITEKPISLNKADVARVYGAAEKNNKKFMVAQVLRFWPEYEYINKCVEDGRYGKVISARMSRLGCYPKWSWDGWMMDEKRSGLVPFDLHIHDSDFIIYTFGKPQNVTSYRAKRPEQDYINAVYQYDGFFITTEASWYASPYPFTANFVYQFENAVVAYEQNVLKVYEKGKEDFVEPFSEGEKANGDIGLPNSNAYFNELLYFKECVKNDKPVEKVKGEQLEEVIDILKSL